MAEAARPSGDASARLALVGGRRSRVRGGDASSRGRDRRRRRAQRRVRVHAGEPGRAGGRGVATLSAGDGHRFPRRNGARRRSREPRSGGRRRDSRGRPSLGRRQAARRRRRGRPLDPHGRVAAGIPLGRAPGHDGALDRGA